MPDGRDNMSMFTVENGSGSPIYKGRRERRDVMQAETEVIDGFVNGVEWTPEKIAEYIYGVPNFIKPQK